MLDDKKFEEIVSSATKPILVDFGAKWCGQCKMLMPVIDKIAEEMKDKIDLVKLDVEEAHQTAAKYNITKIPAIYLIKNSEPIFINAGPISKGSLTKKILENLLPHE